MYVVLKPFALDEQPLASGTLVDASRWRLLRQLVAQRFLRPATADELEAATAPSTTEKKANTK